MASIVITIETDGVAFDRDSKFSGLIRVLQRVVDRLVRREDINGMVLWFWHEPEPQNDRYIVVGKVCVRPGSGH